MMPKTSVVKCCSLKKIQKKKTSRNKNKYKIKKYRLYALVSKSGKKLAQNTESIHKNPFPGLEFLHN